MRGRYKVPDTHDSGYCHRVENKPHFNGGALDQMLVEKQDQVVNYDHSKLAQEGPKPCHANQMVADNFETWKVWDFE